MEPPQTSKSSVFFSALEHLRCTRYQMHGSVSRRCGSLQRIGFPVAERSGPTTQLLLPWPPPDQPCARKVPLINPSSSWAASKAGRVIDGSYSGEVGNSDRSLAGWSL